MFDREVLPSVVEAMQQVSRAVELVAEQEVKEGPTEVQPKKGKMSGPVELCIRCKRFGRASCPTCIKAAEVSLPSIADRFEDLG